MSAFSKVKEYTNEELREIYNDYYNSLESGAPANNMTPKLKELYIAEGGENFKYGFTEVNVHNALIYEIANRFRLGCF